MYFDSVFIYKETAKDDPTPSSIKMTDPWHGGRWNNIHQTETHYPHDASPIPRLILSFPRGFSLGGRQGQGYAAPVWVYLSQGTCAGSQSPRGRPTCASAAAPLAINQTPRGRCAPEPPPRRALRGARCLPPGTPRRYVQ